MIRPVNIAGAVDQIYGLFLFHRIINPINVNRKLKIYHESTKRARRLEGRDALKLESIDALALFYYAVPALLSILAL